MPFVIAHEHRVAAVHGEVTRVGRLVGAVKLTIAGQGRIFTRIDAGGIQAFFAHAQEFGFHSAVHEAGGQRATARNPLGAVGPFTVGQWGAGQPDRRLERGAINTSRFARALHGVNVGDGGFFLGVQTHPVRRQLGRQFDHFRTLSGDVDLYRIGGVDVVLLRVDEADLAPSAFELPFDGFARQQRLDGLHVGFQFLAAHRRMAHRAPPGKAGADTEDDASGRERVERRKAVGGLRRNAIGGDQHPGTELDAAGIGRRQGHQHHRIGGDHLTVFEPRGGETELFRAHRSFPAG